MAACILTGFWYQAQAQPAASEYDVVALRVEFQPDTTRFTTGDGTFAGLTWPVESRVDPLPHDAAYFEAHLAFLRDYVLAASGGRTRIRTHLIDTVIKVSQEMAAYSPHGMDADSDEERIRLARLVEEAWQLADQQVTFDVSGLDPRRTAFVIFHAGIGRDVELTGTALTKTPLDLPSIYFSESALADLGVSRPDFKGRPITNTAIIPRTETRAGVSAISDTPLLLELSINGLLAASFFNFLGVPDLFNTQTGESGIGPFGLMDPLGFFSFRGLFPPLPTAWTRMRLGWIEPLDLIPGDLFSLSSGEAAIAPISESEYFLVENRTRDVDGSGLTLQVWNEGSVSSVQFSELTRSFNRFNVDDFPGGVVTGASNYDWALPGWDADGNQYDGGLLIWHIDERQLSHGVNDNPNHRAVDLEEADGAQDIGFDSNAGSPFDFYYAGNPVEVVLPSGQPIKLYKNRFAHDTTPSSVANDGGESFVVLEDFSAAGTIMSAKFDYGTASGLDLIADYDLQATTSTGAAVQVFGNTISVYTGHAVVFADAAIAPVDSRTRPAISNGRMAAIDTTGAGYVYRVYELDSGSPKITNTLDLDVPFPLKGPLVTSAEADYALFSDGSTSAVMRLTSEADVTAVNDGGLGLVATQSGTYFVGRTQAGPLTGAPRWTYTIRSDAQAGLPVMARDHTGIWGAIPHADGVLVLRSDGTTHEIDAQMYIDASGAVEHIVLADVDDDKALDIVAIAGQRVLGWSQNGALLHPFPLTMGASAASEPLVARITGGIALLVAAANGVVYGFDLSTGGRQREGFPLAVGQSIVSTPALQDDMLHVVTRSGRLRSYALPGVEAVLWGQFRGSAKNTGWVELDVPPDPRSRLLVAAETYNWPNPVRDGRTFFRSMTTEAAQITVTIIDAAGSLIDELEYAAQPHSPTEIHWEANVASGLYFARVRAISATGRKDTQLIKVAVIR